MEKCSKDNFIMLPTVDFCFKELMRNPKVRKGFIAAVLGKDPKEIRKTTLVSTELDRESGDAKQGILDVKVEMRTGPRSIWRCRLLISSSGLTGFCFI